MKTKLISLVLLIATLGFTGCNTTTTQESPLLELAAEEASAQKLLGGKIGAQITATVETTKINTTANKSRVATVDQRAYQSWKKANRS